MAPAGAMQPKALRRSEVLIVMDEMCLVPLVHLLARFLHILGQSRWSTAENTNFTYLQKKK